MEKQEGKLKRAIKNLPEKELENVYEKLPEARKNLVVPYVWSDEEYTKRWLSKEYTGKIYKDEFPKYATKKGDMVRSKSEKIVADLMYEMGIPYLYEYPVHTEGFGTVYPDFKILKLSTREEVFLEYFGMMDDSAYCRRALEKIQEFARNGLILGKNLYAIFESQDVPIDTNLVEKVLKEFI